MPDIFVPYFETAETCPSPNFGPRKNDRAIDMLLLHYTCMDSGGGAQDWLCSEESQVSSHYIVHEDGRVVQMVREADRAWHAGNSFWKGEEDTNSRSIGIEIVNGGHPANLPDYPKEQMAAVVRLCQSVLSRHAIPAAHVLAHSDVAPIRKLDPGEKFNWKLLAQSGVGHWIEPTIISGGRYFSEGDSGQPIEALQAMFRLYGYRIEVDGVLDRQTKGVVEAFQRLFRPSRVDGVADMSTIDTLHRLLSALS